ncbi:hypothetical protein LUZ60_016328 [Juncus effusus]|nr:hypothetical protein LUZ60_016328 [Juncus effusus]
MGSSSISSSNLPFTLKLSKNNFHKNPSKPTNYARKRSLPTIRSSYTDLNDQNTKTDASRVYYVQFKTLEGCKLGISRYPEFEYDAKGGSGNGIGRENKDGDINDVINVDFDVKNLYIPSLSSETTRFLGLPLPPFLKIDIVPEILRGSIDRTSGKVDLMFKSRFWFSIGSIYKAPPLLVQTTLTSEESIGQIKKGFGERLNEEGKCKLVGIATVEPINDFLMNSFLGLPTECIAYLNADILIQISEI